MKSFCSSFYGVVTKIVIIIVLLCTGCSASFFVGDRYKILTYEDIRRIDTELNASASQVIDVLSEIMHSTGMYPHSVVLKFYPVKDIKKINRSYTVGINITFTQVDPGIFGENITNTFRDSISNIPVCRVNKTRHGNNFSEGNFPEDISTMECGSITIALPTYNSSNIFFGTMSLSAPTAITDDLSQYPSHADRNALMATGPLEGIDIMEVFFNMPRRFYP